MKLRTKVLLGLLAVFVAVLASFLVASPSLLMTGYLTVEEEQTVRNVLRVSDALNREAREVSRGDWAAWDDAYRFMADQNPQFVHTNLDAAAFHDLDIDFVAFVDPRGEVVWSSGYDRESNRLKPAPSDILAQLGPGSPLLAHRDTHGHVYGLKMLESGPILIGSRPIATSEYRGPIRGSLIMAQVLTPERLGKLASLVHLTVRLEPVSPLSRPVLKRRSMGISVNPISKQVVAGEMILPDISGRPAAKLIIEQPRNVFWEGQKSAASMLGSILLVSVLFACVIVFLIERLVLSRLARLGQEVSQVSTSGDLGQRVSESGSDEMTGLAKVINTMLSSIEAGEQALRDSEAQARHAMELHEVAARRFQELFDGIPVACFAFDQEGIVYEWNRECERLWGRPAHLVAFRSMFETVIDRGSAPEMRAMINRVFAGEHLHDVEWRHSRADGLDLWVLMSTFPIRGASGEIVGAISASVDITERKKAAARLAESEERFRTSLESMQEGVMLIDATGQIEVCNARGAAILGTTQEQIAGRNVLDSDWQLVGEDGAPLDPIDSPWSQTLRSRKPCESAVVGFRNADGRIAWLSVNAAPIGAVGKADPAPSVVSFTDITERRMHEQQIQEHIQQISEYSVQLELQRSELAEANSKLGRLALTDGLTGLANQRAFREALEREVAAAHRTGNPLSLLLLDVDRFKDFNDTLGHQAGDEVLATVAKVLADTARESDMPARYGGEEFVVLLPDTDEEHASQAAERLRHAIESYPWTLRPVTASFGAATLGPNADFDLLVREADRAMYHSKQGGRNRVTHYADFADSKTDAA